MNESRQTPMMVQYLAIKEKYPDTVLFYRMGDFYEMFYEDAEKAAGILDIALTSRNKNDPSPVPMCGVPYRAADTYIAKLIEHGCKVAVCDQVEDASAARGLVKREVVRVVTPGMILNETLLDQSANNFLLALSMIRDRAALACLDISTGTFTTCEIQKKGSGIPGALIDEALKLDPREVLMPEHMEKDPAFRTVRQALAGRQITYLPSSIFQESDARECLTKKFNTVTLNGFGIDHMPAAISAAGAVTAYVQDTQMQDTTHIYQICPYDLAQYLKLDDRSCRNLELLVNLQTRDKKGSLISILDKTATAMGSRKVKHWLRQPLVNRKEIELRLQAIQRLVDAPHLHKTLTATLKSVYDLERLGSRVSMGQGNARDLLALKNSLACLPELFTVLERLEHPLLNGSRIDDLDATMTRLGRLAGVIETAIREDAPHTLNEGGLINDGYSPELDELVSISRDGKSWIARAQAEEKEKTGLSSLKIKYNKVFGYFIEISKAQAAQVPDHYIRKQTLVNAERFITDEMKQVESKILSAQDKRSALEYDIFCSVRDQVVDNAVIILKMADFIATVDVLQGLARTASENGYTCPNINDQGRITITDGRHPVVEKLITGERYVPNSIDLDNDQNQILLITGPNMAGKSTVLRQVALTVIMAQMGSFVPAEKASLCLVDQIFTRVGALDNLSSGQSTFMVEMEETANIVNNATPRSLVILDEIGRGTSTYDGMSIAWAVARYLHELAGKGVKTLFATHYHELIQLAQTHPRIQNFHVAVKEFNDNIVFLRQLVTGGTNKSYGIQVARLAGIPHEIIEDAKQIMGSIEQPADGPWPVEPVSRKPGSRKRKKKKGSDGQLELFDTRENDILGMLKQVDISNMTPLEGLNFLQELKHKAGV
ncbi:MAG: DNA mismatch repair protein MutS [Desulfotignum sp.]|nr:DNA mismatch repair protein MutS [Desulfotignum sp.]